MYLKLVLHSSVRSRNPLRFYNVIKRLEETLGRKHTWHLEIILPKFVVSCLILGIVGYFACGFLVQRKINSNFLDTHFSYLSIINPLAWSALPAKIGDAHITESKRLFEEEEFQRGLMRLRSGINRQPFDDDARFTLALIYSRIGANLESLDLLMKPLEFDRPVSMAMIQDALLLAKSLGAYSFIVEYTKELSQHTPTLENTPQVEEALYSAQFSALLELEDFPGVIYLSDTWRSKHGHTSFETKARFKAMHALKKDEAVCEELDALHGQKMDAVIPYAAPSIREIKSLGAATTELLLSDIWQNSEEWESQLEAIIFLAKSGKTEISLDLLKTYISKINTDEMFERMFVDLYKAGLDTHLRELMIFYETQDGLSALSAKVSYLVSLLDQGATDQAQIFYKEKIEHARQDHEDLPLFDWFDFAFSRELPDALPNEIQALLPNLPVEVLFQSSGYFHGREKLPLAIETLRGAQRLRPFDQEFAALHTSWDDELAQIHLAKSTQVHESVEFIVEGQSQASEIGEIIAGQRISEIGDRDKQNESNIDVRARLRTEKPQSREAATLARERLERLNNSEPTEPEI